MRRGKLALSCAIAGCLAAGAVSAHHAASLIFDLTREVTVSGVVTEYNLGNPHIRIYFDVASDGSVERWMAEGGSRTVLLRRGWDGTELAPGDRVSVRGHPSRDGSNVVHMEYLTLPDGTERHAEDLDPGALENLRRRRD